MSGSSSVAGQESGNNGQIIPISPGLRERNNSGANLRERASSGQLNQKRRKVDHACVYCRRSHMTCDSGRPCSRCVKRNIGHLCHDESKDSKSGSGAKAEIGESNLKSEQTSEVSSNLTDSGIVYDMPTHGESTGQPAVLSEANDANTSTNTSTDYWSSMVNSSTGLLNLTPYQPPLFISEHAGSEFSSLNDFLTMLEDTPMSRPMDDSPGSLETATDPLMLRSSTEISNGDSIARESLNSITEQVVALESVQRHTTGDVSSHLSAGANGNLTLTTPTRPPSVPETARDKFFLTAADPADGPQRTPEERLKQVINAKLEAGLLAPFNYVKGYARLQRYMDHHMSPASRQRILKPLSIFRPAFRAIAQTLIDVDLVLVEEAFERMLLDYDRVFTSMAIPACLWRRTGEIYRGNKEFAALVEVSVEELRDGKLAIYELLSEDSAVNYWEKYGNIAFDSGQKAVLTSCTLRSRDGSSKRACCFSFTIRRDRYNIPSCIIGNFIPIHP
ncbi:hypothetical protein V1511DRAFT_455522 [Dipodascopsis uninucleata]